MSLVSSRGWDLVPNLGRAIMSLRARSILRKRQTEVKVKRVSGHKTTFLASGTLDASATDAPEKLLLRIADAIFPSRSEKSDQRIARHGKERVVDAAISYSRDNLPVLSEESARHLSQIKERAAARRAKRLADEGSAGLSVAEASSRKGVKLESDHGKLLRVS